MPDALQSDGAISYTQGWTPPYGYPPNQSGYRPVDEGSMNQLFYDITAAIQNLQQNGIPQFITSAMNNGSPYPYAQYAQVLYNGVAYQSLTNANTTTPPSASWAQINLATPNQFIGGTSTGTANAQVVAATSPASGLSLSIPNQTLAFTPGIANTGSTTLAVTMPAIAATIIKKVSGGSLVNLTGGELTPGATAYVTVNSVVPCWVLQEGATLGAMAYLGISGNSGGNDGSGNYAPWEYASAVATASHAYSTGDWGNLVERSNSGSAMTDTTPGISGALPNGEYLFVKNTDATASLTVSPGSGGSYTFGNQTPASIIIEPGETWKLISTGTGAIIWDRTQAATLHTSPSQGSRSNLNGGWTSNTTATWTANSIILEDVNGNARRIKNVTLNLNTATTGAGGLSTGSLAQGWYAIWAIFNPTTGVSSLIMDLSFTAPTLPAGYLFAGLESAILIDSSLHIVGFTQADTIWEYRVGQNLAAMPVMGTAPAGNVGTPTYVGVATANYIPTIAKRGIFATGGNSGTETIMVAPNNSYGSTPFHQNQSISGGASSIISFNVNLNEPDIYWAANGSSAYLLCYGFELNL